MIYKRNSFKLFCFVLSILLLILVLVLISNIEIKKVKRFIDINSLTVLEYDLTDLCVFTEANYTRNPSMADFNTAFQESPFVLEHFPTGTFFGPPAHLKNSYEKNH